ncbi:MAG: protein translocase subunit SecF [Endozoicomonadaceae bacterium]|nr:protein translocase subunit SecF [Endozoicomonadaceae bacterium]
MAEQNVLNYMRWRNAATFISAALMVLSLISVVVKGINWGLDFTGGTLVQIDFKKTPDLDAIRLELKKLGYHDAVVQQGGTHSDVLIRIHGSSAQSGHQFAEKFKADYGSDIVIQRIEYVGPQVGESLKEHGGLGMLLALVLITLYVAFRFQFKFSLGALLSLIHDVLIVLGVFSFWELQFDLNVLAAVLSVIGYSLNDTIVVYDRIRENFRKIRKGDTIDIMNVSLTQMFGRTIATSATTAMVLIALFFLGGDALHNFSLALLVGIAAGTYSSIYVAANLLLMVKIDRKDLLLPMKNQSQNHP